MFSLPALILLRNWQFEDMEFVCVPVWECVNIKNSWIFIHLGNSRLSGILWQLIGLEAISQSLCNVLQMRIAKQQKQCNANRTRFKQPMNLLLAKGDFKWQGSYYYEQRLYTKCMENIKSGYLTGYGKLNIMCP